MVLSERNMNGSERSFGNSQKPLKDALKHQQSPNITPHVVIVMDALREYSDLPLLWALENIMASGCVVTLLGIMPWLNIPTPEIWGVEFEEFATAQASNGATRDPKFFKLQAVVELCNKYGVELNKEVVMGYPQKLVVVEKITGLHATWVVFDRHQRKNREFYASKLPCNMVMMNENGEADMIRGQSMIDNGEFTPGQSESPASSVPTPQLIIPDQWKDTPGSSRDQNH